MTVNSSTGLRAETALHILHERPWTSNLDYAVLGIAMGVGFVGKVLTQAGYHFYVYSKDGAVSEDERHRRDTISLVAMAIVGFGTMFTLFGLDNYYIKKREAAQEIISKYKPYELIRAKDLVLLLSASEKTLCEKLIAGMSDVQIDDAKRCVTDSKIRDYLMQAQCKETLTKVNKDRERLEATFFDLVKSTLEKESLSSENLSKILEAYEILFGKDYKILTDLFEEHLALSNVKLIHQFGKKHLIPTVIELTESYVRSHRREIAVKTFLD